MSTVVRGDSLHGAQTIQRLEWIKQIYFVMIFPELIIIATLMMSLLNFGSFPFGLKSLL